MGFVQFPGTDSNPAKSGPGVAQHLAHVYKEYLSGFDAVYISSVLESRRNMHQAQLSGAQGGPSQHSQTGPVNRSILNANQMQLVLGYANQSAADLRAQGVQEKIVQFVEAHRAHLQRTIIEQGFFRGQLRPNMGQPGSGQNTTEPGPGMQAQSGQGFVGSPRPPNAPAASAMSPHPGGNTARPFMQPQNGPIPIHGNNMVGGRHPQPQNVPMGRLDREQLQNAMAFIAEVKHEFNSKSKFSVILPVFAVLNKL